MKKAPEKRGPGRGQKEGKVTPTPQERRLRDRRDNSDSGYFYISTVGWIDRRENSRRATDGYLTIG